MHRKQLAYIALAAGTALGLASVQLTAHPSAREQRGWASWYGPGFAGRREGERREALAARRRLARKPRAVPGRPPPLLPSRGMRGELHARQPQRRPGR